MQTSYLIEQRMEALLKSKQFIKAAKFAASSIAINTGNQDSVGRKIRDEIAQLQQAGNTEDALKLMGDRNVIFVDVREQEELQRTGKLRGAIHVPRGLLEFQVDPTSPTHKPELGGEKKLVLYCGSGGRSALASKALQQMGITQVAHVAGGFPALQKAGAPREEAVL